MKDLQPYFGPITSESPAGVDYEYDALFQQMQRLAEGTREQQYGDTIIAARPPDWTVLLPMTLQLCQRTRDLRVGVLVVESCTHQYGLEGAAAGLQMLVNWITDLWDDLHPSLDQSEGDDPFMRVNSLGRLCQMDRLPLLLRQSVMLQRPPHSKLQCGELLSALDFGDAGVQGQMSLSEVDSVLLSSDFDKVKILYDRFRSIIASLHEIVRILEVNTGETLWNVESVLSPLQAIRLHLRRHLKQRPESQATTPLKESPMADESNQDSTTPGNTIASTVDPSLLQIASRQQAFAAMEAVTEYFAMHEPSSPVPLLLRRARRIAEQDFMGILRELAPGALGEFQQMTGAELKDAA